jgi:hypothetical protein
VRESDSVSFEVPDDALERLQRVKEEVKDVFSGADFFIPLTVSPLPEGTEPADFIATGLKWPKAAR